MNANENLYENYCCLDLLRAVKRDFLSEAVSGITFPNKDDSSCKSEFPFLKICPFCGAKIKCERTMRSWRWWTEKELIGQ